MMPISRDGNEFSNNEFVETVIHEVIHRYVGDTENNPGIEAYWETVRVQFKDEDVITQNHIIVYATLHTAIERLFGTGRTADIKPEKTGYRRAADIVVEKGAQTFIKQFRDHLV